MTRRSWRKLVLAPAAIVLTLAAVAQVPPQPDAEAAVEAEILRLVNQERAQRGLPELAVEERLRQAAREHSRVMAAGEQLRHQVTGEADVSERLAATGLRFSAAAENIGRVDADDGAPAAHRALMDSPKHRANILSEKYNRVGLGVVRRGERLWVTQDFARAFPALSAEEMKAALVAGIARQRQRHSLAALRVVDQDEFRRLACRADLNSRELLGRLPGGRIGMVLTTFEAEPLPQPLADAALSISATALAVGACAMGPEPGGAGQFRVVVVFF